MRLAIDAHALGTGAGGNESYVRSLLEALSSGEPDMAPVALTPPGHDGQDPAAVTYGDLVAAVVIPLPLMPMGTFIRQEALLAQQTLILALLEPIT